MATIPKQAEPVLTTTEINLLTAWFCPFAQRTAIALEAKGTPYMLHEVALKNKETGQWFQIDEKPDWWLRLNPLGKVPVLAYTDHDGQLQSVYESNVCNEFLDDYDTQHPLMPKHLAQRARARVIIDRFARQYVPNFYSILVRQGREQQLECAAKMMAELKWLEDEADPDGPYFLGKDFSMVDASLAPWFLRESVLEYYRPFPSLRIKSPRLLRWMQAIKQHAAVKATQRHPEEGVNYDDALLAHYSKYADATAKSTSAHDFK